eukprot:SAG31_NODE_1227_length_9239_cov_29.041904_4_plen_93_part_00
MAEDPNDEVTMAARALLLESSDTRQQQRLITQKEATILSAAQRKKMHKEKKNLISAFRKTCEADLGGAKISGGTKKRGAPTKPKQERKLPRW